MNEDKKQALRKKNLIYSLVLIGVVIVVYLYRNYFGDRVQEVTVQGTTMGVVQYNVKYLSTEGLDLSQAVDSLLVAFNQSLSTYEPVSEITRFNKADESLSFESGFFYPVLKSSQEIYKATDGAFDPTVMPLVNAWGFGPEKGAELQTDNLDSLISLVGFDKISFDRKKVSKALPNMQLDFSAIAKGYAVDLVAELLESRGLTDYMVEIGGEVVCKGNNLKGIPWIIGINNPLYNEQGGEFIAAKVQLVNRALATSGNYQNYYIKDGKKYAHTISPKTGRPVEHNLLSASVFAPDCMTADAFATAFMVVGKDSAINLLEGNPKLLGLLIYDDNGTMKSWKSEGLDAFLVD